jgi:IS5 family transposase
MLGHLPTDKQEVIWAPNLELMLDPNHPLSKLTRQLPWDRLEAKFADLYAEDGRPSIPLRVMCSLILPQRMFSLSDERLITEWVQNPYWQYFSGMTSFQ